MAAPKLDKFFGGGKGSGYKGKAGLGATYDPTEEEKALGQTKNIPKPKKSNGPKTRGGMGIGL